MLDQLSYTDVPGSRSDHEITVYALSTCGFCKRALGFLNASSYLPRSSVASAPTASSGSRLATAWCIWGWRVARCAGFAPMNAGFEVVSVTSSCTYSRRGVMQTGSNPAQPCIGNQHEAHGEPDKPEE